MEPQLVSIIVPVYRQAAFVATAIDSVMAQSYANWELLVVSDGHDPALDDVMQGYNDPRIRYFNSKPHGGVGDTRNFALLRSSGNFWVFLDADDALPPTSIGVRMERFTADASLRAVDGWMELTDAALRQTLGWRKPHFDGEPLDAYLRLDERVFTGITAMVRRERSSEVLFDTALTHGEDLLFYIDVFRQWGGRYTAVQEPVYRYRQHAGTAMDDLHKLELGYRGLLQRLRERFLDRNETLGATAKRMRRIMVRSYVKRFKVLSALRAAVKQW